jgi:L-amino acid N-acyltransferase YncA
MPNVTIHRMQPSDWPSVRAIYLEGIATGHATFATMAPDWPAWDAAHLARCRLTARDGDAIVGWVALSPWSRREVYRGVAEISIYVAASARRQGIGAELMAALVTESEANGIWTLQAGIFPENTASIRLHQRFGFRVVGVRERIGEMNGLWRDVVLMERRSA